MRNTYKVISWDAAAGQGLVTDGTSFDGRLQTLVVTSADLQDDAYLQGRLYPGEIISAEEDMNRCADRRLTDILVENGNRSIPSRMDLSMPKNEPFDPEPPQTSAPGELDWPRSAPPARTKPSRRSSAGWLFWKRILTDNDREEAPDAGRIRERSRAQGLRSPGVRGGNHSSRGVRAHQDPRGQSRESGSGHSLP